MDVDGYKYTLWIGLWGKPNLFGRAASQLIDHLNFKVDSLRARGVEPYFTGESTLNFRWFLSCLPEWD